MPDEGIAPADVGALRLDPHPLMTVDETAAALRLSRETIRRMVHARRFAAIVAGAGGQAKILVPRKFVTSLLARAEGGATVVIAEAAEQWAAQHSPEDVA